MIEGLLGIVLLAGGVGLIVHVLTRALALERTRAWPATPGLLVCSRLMPVRSKGLLRRWRHQLVFDYKVDGLLHRGARRRWREGPAEARGYLTRFAAERALRRYPPGGVVWVRHDPADPRRAVLETLDAEAPAHAVMGFAFGTLGCLVMLGAL